MVEKIKRFGKVGRIPDRPRIKNYTIENNVFRLKKRGWLSKINGNRGKSLVPSTIITLIIVAMLIISGPAQAVAVSILGQPGPYTRGSDIDFQVKIEINDPDKYVPVTNISLDLTGAVNRRIIFGLDGNPISGNCNINIEPVSIPTDDFGYGNGYGYDAGTGYGYDFGYGYGYGYGYGSGGGKISFIYNVTIHTGTECFPLGNYSVVAGLNTGKGVAFQSSPFSFEITPVLNWKFISIPYQLNNSTVAYVLNGIQYDGLFGFDPVNKLYIGGVTNFEPLKGYLIHMDTSQDITKLTRLNGQPQVPPSLDVKTGWNLIGTTDTTPIDAETMLGAIDPDYYSIWNFNVSTQSYDNVGINGKSDNIDATHEGTDVFMMQPKVSYWVWATHDTSLPAYSP